MLLLTGATGPRPRGARGPTAFATWDEAELLTVPLLTATGTADAERLCVTPAGWPMASRPT